VPQRPSLNAFGYRKVEYAHPDKTSAEHFNVHF